MTLIILVEGNMKLLIVNDKNLGDIMKIELDVIGGTKSIYLSHDFNPKIEIVISDIITMEFEKQKGINEYYKYIQDTYYNELSQLNLTYDSIVVFVKNDNFKDGVLGDSRICGMCNRGLIVVSINREWDYKYMSLILAHEIGHGICLSHINRIKNIMDAQLTDEELTGYRFLNESVEYYNKLSWGCLKEDIESKYRIPEINFYSDESTIIMIIIGIIMVMIIMKLGEMKIRELRK